MGIATALVAAIFLLVGIAAGYFARRYWAASRIGDVEEKIKRDLADAEAKGKEIVVEAKEKAASLLVELKNEEKDRRKEIDALESRVLHREETLDKKLTDLSAEESKLRAREESARTKEEAAAKKEGEIEARLEKIGSLSIMEAKDPRFHWTDGSTAQAAEESKFLLSQLPDDWRVTIDSHSSSPIFANENEQLIFGSHKTGIVDDEYVLDNMPFPNKEAAKLALRAKEAKQAALMQELLKRDPQALEKILSKKGGHH